MVRVGRFSKYWCLCVCVCVCVCVCGGRDTERERASKFLKWGFLTLSRGDAECPEHSYETPPPPLRMTLSRRRRRIIHERYIYIYKRIEKNTRTSSEYLKKGKKK